MMIRHVRQKARTGFTLVELMVAAAVSIGIMTILTVAFQTSLQLMSDAKAIAKLQERLRSTTTVLSTDLVAEHFETRRDLPSNLSGPHLSDQRLDSPRWRPPERGFFRIWQGSAVSSANTAPYFLEGVDGDILPAYVAHNHMLHFSVKRAGNRIERLFTTRLDPAIANAYSAPPGHDRFLAFYRREPGVNDPTFYSDWAEVAYFLTPQLDSANNPVTITLDEGTAGYPLYVLRRRVRLSLTDGVDPGSVPPADPTWEEVSHVGGTLNTPRTLRDPDRRLPLNGPPNPLASYFPSALGDDIVLSDVISFEVKASWDSNPAELAPGTPLYPPASQNTNPDPNPQLNTASEFPFSDLPPNRNPNYAGVRVFDTWTDQRTRPDTDPDYDTQWDNEFRDPPEPANEFTIPLMIRVKALQIRIRIWDRNSGKVRQMTLQQEV